MFFIPGFLIAWATFPGVIVHEAAHQLFCRWFKLAVFDVKYFTFDTSGPSGYVVHEPTDNFKATLFVSLGPFFVNSVLCVLFCSAAFLQVKEFDVADPLAYFFYWLGLSIGMNAFPSKTDLGHVWALAPAEAKRGNILAIISFPVVALLYVLDFGRVIWADLGYGLLIGIIGPLALFKMMLQ